MKSDQNRAILAVILSGVILFSWQYFFAPKKNIETSKETQIIENAVSNEQTDKSLALNQATTRTTIDSPKEISTPLVMETLRSGDFSYSINNQLQITEATYLDVSAAEQIFESKNLFSIQLAVSSQAKITSFDLNKIDDANLVAKSNLGVNINFTLKNNGYLAISMVKSPESKVNALKISFKSLPGSEGSYLVRNFAYVTNQLETITVGDDDKDDAKIKWLGMDYKYHLFAVIFNDLTPLNINSNSTTNSLTTFLSFPEQTLNFDAIFVKKNYDELKTLGNSLDQSVDFGFFSIIAIPILRGLQYFYSLVSNYGVAIILLTLLIRLLTFPLQYKSTKSMKKMQIVQPELKKLQEKYKGDPKKLQLESMALFKKAGANPFSGCLPLILQMPVFFAFYKVLYNAVELVGAPFVGWITDLSAKDPYYLLPVLMTGAMFLQQKITPTTTTDPAQKKVMLFMPIVFGFIMKDLPSGLNLYIFISTIVAVIMQVLVLKRIKV
jgi:YidC/Oxa1 family membrane protein insertase